LSSMGVLVKGRKSDAWKSRRTEKTGKEVRRQQDKAGAYHLPEEMR